MSSFYCYLKRTTYQTTTDRFPLSPSPVVLQAPCSSKAKKLSALQQRLLSSKKNAVSESPDEHKESNYVIDITSVMERYNLENVYFERENRAGSIITNNILIPYEVYIVHGDYVVENSEEQDHARHSFEKQTVLAFDRRMLGHFGRASHPEKPARLSEIWKMVEQEGLNKRCQTISGTLVSDEDLLLVHTSEHIAGVKYQGSKLYNPSESTDTNENHKTFESSSDVFCNENTAEAALCAAGTLLEVVERVVLGTDGVKNGFAIIRPPGHHAYGDKASGFCIFNNVAVASKAAIKRMGVQRVLVVDWDVHHGNGTEHILQNDENILFFSLHRYAGFYPGTGSVEDVGVGSAMGKTINIPFSDHPYGDGDILFVFQHILLPIACEFNPDLVIVSAGFDAVEGDPLGEMKLTPQIFGHLTHLLQSVANGRIVLSLEGGYKCDAIAHCVRECIRVLCGMGTSTIPCSYGSISENKLLPSEYHMGMYKRVVDIQSNYWKCMKILRQLLATP